MLDLGFAFKAPWGDLFRGGRFTHRFEIWRAGETRVFCFGPGGERLLPYELSGLGHPAVPAPGALPPGRVTVRYANSAVASFGGADGIVLCLYLHYLESEAADARVVPHHVADALLGPGPVPLASHADLGWVSQPATYGFATLAGAPAPPSGADWMRRFYAVYRQINAPDALYLEACKEKRMHAVIHRMTSPPFEAVGGAPLTYADKELRAAGVPPELFDALRMNAGSSAASSWRADRGMGAPVATEQYLRDRLREVVELRGRRPRAVWEAEHARSVRENTSSSLGPYPDGALGEFAAVVRCCIAGDVVLKGAHHPTLLHTWAREACEDVMHALGSLCESQQYVRDHRWEAHGGKLRYNGVTDENTMSTRGIGDCEDSNTVPYMLFLLLLASHYARDDVLHWVKAVAVACGVPACVSGSAQFPDKTTHGELASAAHLFGFVIPRRIFTRMLWNVQDKPACVKQMRAMMGADRGFSDVYDLAMPMLIETILFTTPDYTDPERHRCDGRVQLYETFARVMRQNGESLNSPRAVGAHWPLTLARTHAERGFVIHGRAIQWFTAAVPRCFARDWRLRQTFNRCAADAPRADAALDRTFRFVAESRVDDADRVTNVGGETNNTGVLVLELYNEPCQMKLVVGAEVSEEAAAADAWLVRHDRPFVPLDGVDIAPQLAAFRRLLAERGVEVTQDRPVPYESFQRFTVHVYANAVEQGVALLQATLAAFPKHAGLSLFPYCYSVACVIHLA